MSVEAPITPEATSEDLTIKLVNPNTGEVETRTGNYANEIASFCEDADKSDSSFLKATAACLKANEDPRVQVVLLLGAVAAATEVLEGMATKLKLLSMLLPMLDKIQDMADTPDSELAS